MSKRRKPVADTKDHPPVPLPVSTPPRREKVMLDKERTIMYDLNALILLEEKYGMPLEEATTLIVPQKGEDGGLQMPKLRDIRVFLWAGLKHEEKDGFTEEDAGRLISIFTLGAVVSAMNRAMSQHLPDPPESGENETQVEDESEKN